MAPLNDEAHPANSLDVHGTKKQQIIIKAQGDDGRTDTDDKRCVVHAMPCC